MKVLIKSAWGDALSKVVSHGVAIHVWGACARARGVLDSDLAGKNAHFSEPVAFVRLVEWADWLLTE